MKVLLLISFGVLLAGCQSMQTSQPIVYAGGDGSSCDQAVVIHNAEFRETGMLAEKVWLDKNYPGCRQTAQSELAQAGKHFDLVELTTADNHPAKVYFDTTECFAK